jgi:hypothetical protein
VNEKVPVDFELFCNDWGSFGFRLFCLSLLFSLFTFNLLGFLLLLFLLGTVISFLVGSAHFLEESLQFFLLLLLFGFFDILLSLFSVFLGLFMFGFGWDLSGLFLFFFLAVGTVVVSGKGILDGVEMESLLLEFFSFESSLDSLEIGELSSEFFLGIEGYDVRFLLFLLIFFLGFFDFNFLLLFGLLDHLFFLLGLLGFVILIT